MPTNPGAPLGARPGEAAIGRGAYLALVRRAALAHGVPPDLADAVAQIESGYDPRRVGGVGEIGLMQVRPETAAMLGFGGSPADLARPEVNVRYGAAYLAGAWRLAGGDLCRALAKYRAGHGAETISALSRSYCRRARAHLASIGSPLAALPDGFAGSVADPVPAPDAFRSPAAVRHAARSLADRAPVCRRGTAACDRSFWAAHAARIRALNARIVAAWRARGARV